MLNMGHPSYTFCTSTTCLIISYNINTPYPKNQLKHYDNTVPCMVFHPYIARCHGNPIANSVMF